MVLDLDQSTSTLPKRLQVVERCSGHVLSFARVEAAAVDLDQFPCAGYRR